MFVLSFEGWFRGLDNVFACVIHIYIYIFEIFNVFLPVSVSQRCVLQTISLKANPNPPGVGDDSCQKQRSAHSSNWGNQRETASR